MASQAVHILDIAQSALHKLNSSMRDVVRTRIMVKSVSDMDEVIAVCKEHGWVLAREGGVNGDGGGVRPANAFVGGQEIIGDGLLVEIEFEAVVGSGSGEVLRI
jgi:enamine deaminase RidA (YjgF/YER057c/UK114 family)